MIVNVCLMWYLQINYTQMFVFHNFTLTNKSYNDEAIKRYIKAHHVHIGFLPISL